MSRKKPQLTKAGSVRKRAPGAGRPSMGRTSQPPKIKPGALKTLREIARDRKSSVAEAIELSAQVTAHVMIGLDPRPLLGQNDHLERTIRQETQHLPKMKTEIEESARPHDNRAADGPLQELVLPPCECGNAFIECFGSRRSWWVGCKPCNNHVHGKTRQDARTKWESRQNVEDQATRRDARR